MAKVTDDMPNFDNLDIPDDTPLAENTPQEGVSPVEKAEESPVVEVAPIVEDHAEVKEEPTKGIKEFVGHDEGPSRLPLYLASGAAVGLPLIAFGLAAIGTIFVSTAVYVILMGYILLACLVLRESINVYTVFLGCILAAILTASYCLWVELGRYRFDVKARQAKQRISMTTQDAAIPGGMLRRIS